MYFSKLFVRTLKETPAEAELASHRLMLRAGLIKKLAAGIYSLLPLGYRTIRKIENIVREEMNKSDAQEVLLPAMVPAKLWQETGRWDKYGPELLRIKDRHNRDFCLGPTHEEVVTDLVRSQVKSYRDLPVNLYQIQTKVRDEIRPRFGLMRCREFIMKDAYSFDTGEDGVRENYDKMFEAYERIFRRCGLEFRAVEADSGAIGGSFSHEFMVMAKSGEDQVVSCTVCSYAANMEKAAAKGLHNEPYTEKPMELVKTPGKKTVEEVTEFLGVSPDKLIKTILFTCKKIKADKESCNNAACNEACACSNAGEEVVVALIRGDREINETKLKNLLDADELILAGEAKVREVTGCLPGFAGPVGLKNVRIVADESIGGLGNAVTGANTTDHHYINVTHKRDFEVDTTGDFSEVKDGDLCMCGGTLRVDRGIEVGHVFKLGTKYSSAMKATFLDQNGKEKPIVMGCYGIGIGRTMAASIEQNNDKNGIIWPMAIAPYEVLVMPMNVKDESVFELAKSVYDELSRAGLEVVLDDRNERPGVKFKDAELIGFPIVIVLGKKTLEKGSIEVRIRQSSETIWVTRENICGKILDTRSSLITGDKL